MIISTHSSYSHCIRYYMTENKRSTNIIIVTSLTLQFCNLHTHTHNCHFLEYSCNHMMKTTHKSLCVRYTYIQVQTLLYVCMSQTRLYLLFSAEPPQNDTVLRFTTLTMIMSIPKVILTQRNTTHTTIIHHTPHRYSIYCIVLPSVNLIFVLHHLPLRQVLAI